MGHYYFDYQDREKSEMIDDALEYGCIVIFGGIGVLLHLLGVKFDKWTVITFMIVANMLLGIPILMIKNHMWGVDLEVGLDYHAYLT